jgi:small GTP-binding protein
MADAKFKVILLGDASVGKTSIARRHANGTFEFKMLSTVGVDHLISTVNVQGRQVKLLLWDTAGQEEFSSLVPMYARGAQVCIIVGSIVDLTSLTHIELWEKRLNESGESPSIIVAINKTDLLDGAPITMEAIREQYSAKYPNLFFVSARTGDSISEVFYQAALLAMQAGQVVVNQEPVSLDDDSKKCGC